MSIFDTKNNFYKKSILDTMIKYGGVTPQKNCPLYDIYDPATNFQLTKIDKNQRNRWKIRKTVPWQVLETILIWGIDLGINSGEKRGVALETLTDLLWNFHKNCNEPKDAAAAYFIYENIVRYEFGRFSYRK